MGCVVHATPLSFYTQERTPVPIVEEAGWTPRPVWMGMTKRKYFAPTVVRDPDCPTSGESLYQLRILGPSELIGAIS